MAGPWSWDTKRWPFATIRIDNYITLDCRQYRIFKITTAVIFYQPWNLSVGRTLKFIWPLYPAVTFIKNELQWARGSIIIWLALILPLCIQSSPSEKNLIFSKEFSQFLSTVAFVFPQRSVVVFLTCQWFSCAPNLVVSMQSLGEKKKGEEDEQLWRRKTGSKDKQRQEAAGGWGKDKARWGWITVAQIMRKGEDQQQRETQLEKKGERRPRHNEKGQRWIIDRAMGQGTWCTVELKLCWEAEFYWVVAADPVGFPGGRELICQAGDAGDPDFIPGSGRSPGEGNGNHSSILVWEIPWTEEPGGPQSMGSQRAGHDWATEYVHKWTQWMAQENKEVGVLTVGQSRVPSILLPEPLTSCFCS